MEMPFYVAKNWKKLSLTEGARVRRIAAH